MKPALLSKLPLDTRHIAANDNSYLQLAVNNTAGNIATVTNTPSGGSATTIANYSAGYLPFGPPKGVTLGNGIATSYTYDKDLNLLTILSDNSTQNLTYTYDNAGNLTNIADSLNSANNQTLTYDVIDRLTNAVSGSGGYGTLAYAYDKNGNRTSHTIAGTTTNYTTATSKNRLTAVGSQSITINNNGSITAISPAMPSGVTALAYNEPGRLISASSASSTLQTNLYDSGGARVKKVAGSITTKFVKGLSNEFLQETDGTNTLNYLYANGVPIAQFNTSGTLTYIHTDQRGAPVKATNTSKASQWSTDYDPFGQTINLSNPGSLTMNLRLPGQYYDAETGLYDNGYRSYDPITGRYIQSDPIGMAGGTNPYAYVGGSPFMFTDELGLYPGWDCAKNGICNEPPPTQEQMDRAFNGFMTAMSFATLPLSFTRQVAGNICINLISKENILFGRSIGLLNNNPYLRIGWGWRGTRQAGEDIFRVGFGNKNSWIHWHWDFW